MVKIFDYSGVKLRLRSLLISFLAVLVIGSMGFHLIEGQSLFHGLYMTALTITTMGFNDIHPTTDLGRVFTLFVLFAGFGVAFLALSQLAGSILRGELAQAFGRRKMDRTIKTLSDHYILCGFGRMGRVIASELQKKNIPRIIIETNRSLLALMEEDGHDTFIVGNASDEAVLKKAGIERAKGLVTAVSSDADNAFITMTARGLSKECNPSLRIVARADETSSVSKLKLAGADKVVSPYVIGGNHIAQAILSPALVDFMEIATDKDRPEVEIADVEIKSGCHFDGKRLDSNEMKALDLIFVSIQRADKTAMFRPGADTIIRGGDRVIAVGRPEKIQIMLATASR